MNLRKIPTKAQQRALSRVYRVCAVCGKRHAPTYGFARVLAWHGIKGDKAAIECIRKLQATDLPFVYGENCPGTFDPRD